MKKIHQVFVASILLTAVPCHAASLGDANDIAAPSLMMYSAIPLDGSPRQKDEVMRFGFRLDYSRTPAMMIGRDRVNELVNYPIPAFFDFSLNGNRLPEMKINGISALNYGVVSDAAGGVAVAATGVNWTYVAYGVVTAFAVDMELEDDPEQPPVQRKVSSPCFGYTMNITC